MGLAGKRTGLVGKKGRPRRGKEKDGPEQTKGRARPQKRMGPAGKKGVLAERSAYTKECFAERSACRKECLQSGVPAELRVCSKECLQNGVPAEWRACIKECLQIGVPAEQSACRKESLQK